MELLTVFRRVSSNRRSFEFAVRRSLRGRNFLTDGVFFFPRCDRAANSEPTAAGKEMTCCKAC